MPLTGDVELQLLARLHGRYGVEQELEVRRGYLEIEVAGDHQHVDGQLQLHPAGAESGVGAQAVGRIPGAEVLIAGRQVAVDVELEGVREDFLHIMRGGLGNEDP